MKRFILLSLVSAAIASAAACTGGTFGGGVIFSGGTTPIVSGTVTCGQAATVEINGQPFPMESTIKD